MYASSQLMIVTLVVAEDYFGTPSSSSILTYLVSIFPYIANPLLLIKKHFDSEKRGWYFRSTSEKRN
jgi:hypothetical protein